MAGASCKADCRLQVGGCLLEVAVACGGIILLVVECLNGEASCEMMYPCIVAKWRSSLP